MNYTLLFIFLTCTSIFCVDSNSFKHIKRETKNPGLSNLIWYETKGLYFGLYKMNWFNAFQFCRFHDMQLLTLNSVEELSFVITHIKRSDYTDSSYWTGGSDLGTEGKFVWMTTGVPFSSKSALWAPGQPDNHENKEDCTHLFRDQDFKLNDHECQLEFYFICETIS